MPRRITIDDIKKINELYYNCHNYAEVARQTGWSPSTVRSYVDKNYNPITEDQVKRFDPTRDMPELRSFALPKLSWSRNWRSSCSGMINWLWHRKWHLKQRIQKSATLCWLPLQRKGERILWSFTIGCWQRMGILFLP